MRPTRLRSWLALLALVSAASAAATPCAETGAPAPAVTTLMASKANPTTEAWIVTPTCTVQVIKLVPNINFNDYPMLVSANAGIERIESIPSKTQWINITGSPLSKGADLSAATDLVDTVRLSDAPLNSLDHITFADSTNQLDLRNANLTSLKNAKLPSKLTWLSLYDCQLASLDFKIPPGLKSLRLNNNHIAKLENLQLPNSLRVLDFTGCPITTVRGVKFSSSFKNLFFGPSPVSEFEVRETDFENFARILSVRIPVTQTKCSDPTAQLKPFKESMICVISDDRFAARYSIESNGGASASSQTGSASASGSGKTDGAVPVGGSGSHGSTASGRVIKPVSGASKDSTIPTARPPLQDTTETTKTSSSTTTIVAVVIIVASLLAVVIAFIGYRAYKKRKHDDASEAKYTSHDTDPSTNSDDGFLTNDIRTDDALMAFHLDEQHVEITEELARGGYGVIFRGRYRDRDVAIKRVLPKTSHDDAALALFMAEIRLCAALTHPKIVEFVGVTWTSRHDISAVIELMAFGDLRKLLETETGPSPTSWSQPWTSSHLRSKILMAQDIAEALVYLHSFNQPILHRDVKARNVLLDDRGNAKLSDFGISRELSPEETMTREVGTAAWVAPEVLRGERYNDKADVYSFGVLLVEMDTCRHPLPSTKQTNTQVAVLVSAGQLRPTVSPECPLVVHSLVNQCLSFDAADRPTAMEVFYALRQATRAFQQSAFV